MNLPAERSRERSHCTCLLRITLDGSSHWKMETEYPRSHNIDRWDWWDR